MFHKKSLILALFLSMVTSFGLLAQNRTVTGVVRDSNGEPLMGAGVVVSGTPGELSRISTEHSVCLFRQELSFLMSPPWVMFPRRLMCLPGLPR